MYDSKSVEATLTDWDGNWKTHKKLHEEIVADMYCQDMGFYRAVDSDFEHFTKEPRHSKSIQYYRIPKDGKRYRLVGSDYGDYGGESSMIYVLCVKHQVDW